jgi:hypothetical protein
MEISKEMNGGSADAITDVDLIIQDLKIEDRSASTISMIAFPTLNKLASTASQGQWYTEDKIDMSRFKEMVPNPAISYPFELDDF